MISGFQNGMQRSRSFVAGAVVVGLIALGGCSNSNLPAATIPASGVTSSNGGGMRATGAIPDVGVTNGQATVGTMSSNPRVPRY
ncbi:MAG: hypothetical protein ACRYF2_22375 [Janthinobacterium lividum]